MFYLAWQTLFWLILAFLFGLFIGWLIWGRRWRISVDQTWGDQNLAQMQERLDQCEKNLALYKQELEQACKEQKTVPLPAAIPSARPEEADDLQELVGVGPYLEKKLNHFGIYTFRQVAALTPEVIKELGATFGSFSDRIVREKWVEQAKKLHQQKHGTQS